VACLKGCCALNQGRREVWWCLGQLLDCMTLPSCSFEECEKNGQYVKTSGDKQWRTQKSFMGGFIQWHLMVFYFWCALFVTSQFYVIVIFQDQHVGEACWHNMHIFVHALVLFHVIALNINYQRSKFGYRRKINSTLRHSSS